MTISVVLRPPDADAFAPFGAFIAPPDVPGRRQFYSAHLDMRAPAAAPVVHVNHVLPSTLPMTVTGLERHPHAEQFFIPLDVARYAVVVMPSDSEGMPVPGQALGFLMPGTMGVIYRSDVWHLGATVFDRPGHFTVLMYRGGVDRDDVFLTVPPLTLVSAGPRRLAASREELPR